MIADFLADWSPWLYFVVGVMTFVALLYGFCRWLRRAFRQEVGAVFDQKIVPVQEAIDAINAAVNNTRPGEPKIKDRVKRVEQTLAAQDVTLARQDRVLETLRVSQLAAEYDHNDQHG